jgi:hypothetical protein
MVARGVAARHDEYVNANSIPVEEHKPAQDGIGVVRPVRNWRFDRIALIEHNRSVIV